MVDLLTIQTIGVIVAAFSFVVGVANNILTSRREEKRNQQTLETRQAQMFMNIYEKTTTKEFNTAWVKWLVTPWKTFEDYKNLMNSDQEFAEANSSLGSFYEGLGVLVREGLIDIRYVALLICGVTRAWFEKYLPILVDGRRITGMTRWMSESEYLYHELIRYLGEHPELDTRIEKPLIDSPP